MLFITKIYFVVFVMTFFNLVLGLTDMVSELILNCMKSLKFLFCVLKNDMRVHKYIMADFSIPESTVNTL